MANEQIEKSLQDVYDFRSGLSKAASEFGSGYPFLTFKDVFYNTFVPSRLGDLVQSTAQERECCDIRRGDVFLTRTSETMEDLGMSCVALRHIQDATFNGFTKRLRPKNDDEVVPEYAGYFFRSQQFRCNVSAMSSLSTRASLNNDMLGRLRIKLPDPVTQAAIGSVLKCLDDKIEQNRRTSRCLQQLTRAMFRAWFVDFEPVKAKTEGATTFPAMPQPVFDAMPSRLIDSDIGTIPEGWEMGTLGSLLKESTNRNNDEDVDLVLSAVNTGELVASDDHFNKRVYSKSLSNYKVVPPGAIAFNPSRINIGSVGVNHRDVAGVVSPAYVVCSAPREYEWFFEFFLRLPGVRKQFETLSSGSVRQSLKSVDFLSVELAIPKREMVHAFNHEFMHYRGLLASLDAESKKLAEIRDYLLPRLLSGSVRVEVVDG